MRSISVYLDCINYNLDNYMQNVKFYLDSPIRTVTWVFAGSSAPAGWACETRGALAGRCVVRGREAACAKLYTQEGTHHGAQAKSP